jgi:hypothetical protein
MIPVIFIQNKWAYVRLSQEVDFNLFFSGYLLAVILIIPAEIFLLRIRLRSIRLSEVAVYWLGGAPHLGLLAVVFWGRHGLGNEGTEAVFVAITFICGSFAWISWDRARRS